MNKPAAIYARVSSDRQKEQHTIASQTAALIEHAQANGYTVPAEWIFEDEGPITSPGDHKINGTIIIEVCAHRSDSPAGDVEATITSDVRECAVALVPQQGLGHPQKEPGAPRDEKIHPAVIVVIKYCDAPTHCFQQVLLRSWRSSMLEVDPACRRDVRESYG